MFFSTRSLAALASLLCAAGCAAGTSEDGSSANDQADLTGTTATQAAGLAGAFTTSGGDIKGLVLGATSSSFVADIDTGVECITAPCPSSEHVVGTFTSTATTITFASDTASPEAAAQLGTYDYKLTDGVLSLTRGEATARKESALKKAYSYCSVATDCQIQAIEHAHCFGSWACAANACSFTCGTK